jgi:CheY-like chemotaxis protein
MKPTILLIEDNEQNLYLATFLLEQNGFTVVPRGLNWLAASSPPSLFSTSSCRRWMVTPWRRG